VTDKKPSKDFSTRLSAAKKWRRNAEPDIKEAVRFCDPGAEHAFKNGKPDGNLPSSENFISLPEELASDLSSDFVTYYTPPEARWMDWEVTTPVPEDQAEAILGLVREREDGIFELIESSNYYDVAPQVFLAAASHGTPAMWVDQAHMTQPVYVEPVPIHELYVTPGHMGYLDRFRENWILSDHLKATFDSQDVDLNHDKIKAKISKPGSYVKLTRGFWLDWSDPASPKWVYEATVDDIAVTPEKQILGPLAGACPLLVGRFNPRTGRPLGRGPGIKAIPDILTMDDISEKVLDNMDAALSPSWWYQDDGVLDVREGFERGTTYPGRAASGAPQKLDLSGEVDQGWFTIEQLEERLRVAFYQDGPRQRGDTPPSATQWVDERRRVQKRIGKPSAPLWSELIYPFVQRIEWIGVQTGKFDQEITHNGAKLSITPVSPLQKAQNQDKVLTTRSNLDLAVQSSPEGADAFIDFPATFKKIVDASGDELLVLKDGDTNEVTPPAS
tara:strand:- start:736 stop:2238 length:1503 start_codon:yes stop_codon:yes gene_type:complete